VGALPTGRWDELRRVFLRYEHAQQRGWLAAGEAVLSDLNYQLRRLMAELEAVSRELPPIGRQGPLAAPSAIAADLLALSDEFEQLSIDLKEKVLRVTTAAIDLEDVYLGPFQIVLHWERIGFGRAYQVKALQPNCPPGRADVTHPHVEDHVLCEGAGATAIRNALTGGRLLDFFVLVRQILETYNGGSAYVQLADWSGNGDVCCEDCGYETPLDDSSICDRCDRRVCSECSCSCSDCGRFTCSECRDRCSGCCDSFCSTCLTSVGGDGPLLCATCLKKKEQPSHEDDQCPAPEVDALCLGETAAPA
jgi:hypothetical protein